MDPHNDVPHRNVLVNDEILKLPAADGGEVTRLLRELPPSALFLLTPHESPCP